MLKRDNEGGRGEDAKWRSGLDHIRCGDVGHCEVKHPPLCIHNPGHDEKMQ